VLKHRGELGRYLPQRCRRVLVVDDEHTVLTAVSRWLEEAGWSAVCAPSPAKALLAADDDPDLCLAVIDYRLDGQYEGIHLGAELRRKRGLPFILISGYLNTSVIVEAMKAGAVDVIDKPLTPNRFLALIGRSAGNPQTAGPSTSVAESVQDCTAPVLVGQFGSVTSRWARMVLKACGADEDPRTVPFWGRTIAASTSTIEETCRLCDVKAHDSKDLARFLRALAHNRTAMVPLRSYFDVADERTLEGLFERAGMPIDTRLIPLKVFLSGQIFISTGRPCLRELAHLAANSPLFF